MFRFANPQAFQYLWFLPVLVAIYFVMAARSRKRLAKALGPKVAPVLTASVSRKKRVLKLMLQCLALIFFIIAYARPQVGKSMQKIKSEGVEMMIAFDVSTSMLTEDVKPSRLQQAKAEIGRLLDLLSGDKVGLVAFAGSAVLVSPLTTDKASLKMFVDSLSPLSVETQGTDIHKALKEARAAFERGGTDPDEGSRVTRVILFVSDGEDHEQGAMDEARALTNEGVRIFSMAVGTERGGPIPVRDERGYIQGYKKDRQGKEVLSQTKGTILREIAAAGKGGFYAATFGDHEARLIKEDLDKLEKSEFDSDVSANYDEKYQIFLLLGLLVAFSEMLLGERREMGRIWRGRFEVADP